MTAALHRAAEVVGGDTLEVLARTGLTFTMHGAQYAVLVCHDERPGLLEKLTPSERDVALAILRGDSNRAIARMRGRAERTVANQVAAVFRKLGVGSRAELSARVRQPTYARG